MSDVRSTRVCAACPCHGLPTFSHLALTHHPFQSLHTSLLFTQNPPHLHTPSPPFTPPLLFTKPPPLPSHPFPSLHTSLLFTQNPPPSFTTLHTSPLFTPSPSLSLPSPHLLSPSCFRVLPGLAQFPISGLHPCPSSLTPSCALLLADATSH